MEMSLSERPSFASSSDHQPSGSRAPLHRFKLVLLGESGVGKTSLALRFVRDQFSDQFESTIGSAFFSPTLRLGEREGSAKLEIWDTAGQERYRSLAPLYYRGAYAALVVYDLTDRGSFTKVPGWVEELRSQRAGGGVTGGPEGQVLIVMVGNKVDLAESGQREVQWKEAQNYAAENGLMLIETSAKLSLNVTELFTEVARKLVADKLRASNGENSHSSRGGIRLGEEEGAKMRKWKKKCC